MAVGSKDPVEVWDRVRVILRIAFAKLQERRCALKQDRLVRLNLERLGNNEPIYEM